MNWEIKVAVVIRPWKNDVYDYVKKSLKSYHQRIEIILMLFNENYHEWAGSVYAANQAFSKYNIVFLPDTAIRLSYPKVYTNNSGLTLLELMLKDLKLKPLTFAWAECHNPEKLINLGALSVENNLVMDLQDKPNSNLDQYNAFWGAYGFRKTAAKMTYDFLSASIQHQDLNKWKKKLFPTQGVEFAEYWDLGTWDSINKFRMKFQPSNFITQGS
ncbi:MAG: hypothetical protein V1872_11575 [bacterium]